MEARTKRNQIDPWFERTRRLRSPAFFADPFAIRAPGFVVVQEYDSSPPSHGSLGLGRKPPHFSTGFLRDGEVVRRTRMIDGGIARDSSGSLGLGRKPPLFATTLRDQLATRVTRLRWWPFAVDYPVSGQRDEERCRNP